MMTSIFFIFDGPNGLAVTLTSKIGKTEAVGSISRTVD